VANWFSRSTRRIEVPRLRSRSDEQLTTKVDLHEFTPPLREFLGRAAYVQLTIFENLSRALASAPTTPAKLAIGRAAELSISRHRALTDEIVRDGGVVSAAIEPYVDELDEFERVTRGGDWFEMVVTCYLTAGFLDDFFERLSVGLTPEMTKRIAAIYESDAGEVLLAEQLQIAINESPRLASRLAMWGRRLVGDTMLVARAALHFTADHTSDEARVEPVFTELIAAHTRRMDFLGLTA
jgi:hypothetical protein